MTAEQVFFAHTQCFAYQPTGRIPDPPIFDVKGLKYTVPPYYSFNHSETQWLVNMIKGNNWARIHRVISCNQCYLLNTYCQYPDSPDPFLGQPMFHRKAILYLTPLALAIYLKQHRLAKRMMEYENERKEKVVDVNQPCFVTNYLERFDNINDIMLIYPFCVMFRRECFEVAETLLLSGWQPLKEISLPYRRICQVFVFHYKDIVEYCIAQMVTRPNLRLPRLLEKLIGAFHENFTTLHFENVIIKDSGEGDEIEDFVSIPRRMLRYIYYYDHNMMLISQVISSIRVFQQYDFYNGPRRDPLKIDFTQPVTGNDEQNMINDQDNSIALILAICDEADLKGHLQTRVKLLDLLAVIIVDTKWYINFLGSDSEVLSNYFSNLIERIRPLKRITIEILRVRLLNLIDITEIDPSSIKELHDPDNPKKNWRKSLDIVLEKRRDQKSNNNDTAKSILRNAKELSNTTVFNNLSVTNIFDGPITDVYFGSSKP